MTELVVRGVVPAGLMAPDDADKDTRHRLGRYLAWLGDGGRPWHTPDLAAYRDHLLESLSMSSVSAHLSTIRGRYRAILRDRPLFWSLVPDDLPIERRKAIVDEAIARLEAAIDPAAAPTKTVTRQDRPDADVLRLTGEQASALIATPGAKTLGGLRDTAVIALMLCTGIREAELSALDVADLRQELGGELALHVREGKGCKERMIPYGELSWCLAIVDSWLAAAGIEDGAVFRGFYKSGRLRLGRLSVRAVQYILADYPVMVDGELRTAKPHDLRRTYAKRYYMAGGNLAAVQQNLGHADQRTTLNYIGELDADQRRPPAIYQYDLRQLNGWRVQRPLA